jgi:hypothetical protein
LPPFAIANNLSPGRIIGISGVGVERMFWTGGSPKGIVRWWLAAVECRDHAAAGNLAPLSGRFIYYQEDANGVLPTLMFLHTPDASEEVTLSADGLKYGGRLSYLYVYRFGGLRVAQ